MRGGVCSCSWAEPEEGATDLSSRTKRCIGRTLLEEDRVQSAPHMSLKGTRHGCGVCMQEEPSLLKRAVCHCWTRARSSSAGAQGEVAARVTAARRWGLVLSIHS